MLCFFAQKTQAQKADKIYQMDSTVVLVTIVSTEGDTIWYHPNIVQKSRNLSGLLKTDVDKIVYQNGVIEYYGGKTIQYPPINSKRTADVVYKKDGTQFVAHVKSIKGDSVYYQAEFNEVNRFVFSLPKSQIDKICYKNGLIVYLSGPAAEKTQLIAKQEERQRDSVRRSLDRTKNILKVTPFSFIGGYTTFGYERRLGASQSVEAEFGVIHHSDKDLPAKGYYGAIGLKLILRGDEILANPRHKLEGWYFRPEMAIGSYSHEYKNEIFRSGSKTPEIVKGLHQVSYKCGVLNFGKQWVSAPLIVDLFAGLGYGSYRQSAGSLGIVETSKYAYRMDMDAASGDNMVKLRLGLYLGFVF